VVKSRKGKMNGAYDTHGRNVKCMQSFIQKLEGEAPLRKLVPSVGVLLKCGS
jgi:hypothetical protein